MLTATWKRATSHMNPPVFFGAAALVVAFVLFGSLAPETAYRLFDVLQATIVDSFGWFYMLAATAMLAVAVFLLAGRHGRIRLGAPGSRPEFGRLTWFAMLMAAGMGIGVMFFGVQEPLAHFAHPPLGAEPRSPEAMWQAMQVTYLHWGLHPWSIYIAMALPLAYYHFRHDLPLAPRSLLYPLLGDGIHRWPGDLVDVVCTVGTLFGVATSLGLGAVQINAGLNRLLGLPQGVTAQVGVIAAITAAATISVVSGVKRGIRLLSSFNVGLAGLLLLFVLLSGPLVLLLDIFVASLGRYLQHLPQMGLWVQPGASGGWQAKWTLFYWSWWFSWSPFVGVFVARVSRGRSVRELVLAGLAVPTVLGFLWFAVMGGAGYQLEQAGHSVVVAAQDEVKGSSLFAVLSALPAASVTTVVATVLIIFFFVTSSDSGSLVNDMVTSGGDPHPPRAQRVFWALAEGAVAASLLVSGTGGQAGLRALRSASLVTGLPLAVLLLVACYGAIRALRRDLAHEGVPPRDAVAEQDLAEQDPGADARDRPSVE